MKSIFLGLVFFSFGFLSLHGQKVLSLENAARFKRIIFAPGDYIRFQGQDGQAKYSGMIEEIDESFVVLVKSIVIGDQTDKTAQLYRDYVPIEEIRAVINSRPSAWRTFRNGYYATAILAGGMFIGGTTLNTMIEGSTPDPTTLVVASGFLTSGLLVRYLGRDKYKLGKRWELVVRDPLDMPEPISEK